MRKFTFFFLIIPILLIYINSDFPMHKAEAGNIYDVTYESPVYEPVEPFSSTNISGSIFILNGPSKSTLRVKYDLYSPLKFGDEDSYKSGYVSTSFSFPATKKIDYSFTINDSKNYARKGIKVKLGIYDTASKKYLDYIESYLFNKEDIYIDIDDIAGELVIDRCLSLNSTKYVEKYDFTNFSHILELDNYYRLDLSSLSFKYDFYKDYRVSSASLSFVDAYNLFPYIEGEGNIKRVPLFPYINNKEVYFKFNGLYTKKNTLEMSLNYQEGFVETNYFYFPKNQLWLLQGSLFALNIYQSGVSSLCFDFDFEVDIKALLLGPCNEASYCVVGGIKK